MPRMLRVQATRTFQSHSAGDVFLVEEDDHVAALVRNKLFNVLAVEIDTPEPVLPVGGIVVPEPESEPESESEPEPEPVEEPVAVEKPEKPAARTTPKRKAKAKSNV